MSTYPQRVLAALDTALAAMEDEHPSEVAAADLDPLLQGISRYVAQYRAQAEPLLDRATALRLRLIR